MSWQWPWLERFCNFYFLILRFKNKRELCPQALLHELHTQFHGPFTTCCGFDVKMVRWGAVCGTLAYYGIELLPLCYFIAGIEFVKTERNPLVSAWQSAEVSAEGHNNNPAGSRDSVYLWSVCIITILRGCKLWEPLPSLTACLHQEQLMAMISLLWKNFCWKLCGRRKRDRTQPEI